MGLSRMSNFGAANNRSASPNPGKVDAAADLGMSQPTVVKARSKAGDNQVSPATVHRPRRLGALPNFWHRDEAWCAVGRGRNRDANFASFSSRTRPLVCQIFGARRSVRGAPSRRRPLPSAPPARAHQQPLTGRWWGNLHPLCTPGDRSYPSRGLSSSRYPFDLATYSGGWRLDLSQRHPVRRTGRAGSQGQAARQHRRVDAPRRLRLADNVCRRHRHVLRQRPAGAGARCRRAVAQATGSRIGQPFFSVRAT
jgi:hypothetical protein